VHPRCRESGRIDHGIRDGATYFTLRLDYTGRYSGPHGIVYSVTVDEEIRDMIKPITYSTKAKKIGLTNPRNPATQPHYLAIEMAFVADSIPLDPKHVHVSVLYPVIPSIPPKPVDESVVEFVREFTRRGFETYPFYFGLSGRRLGIAIIVDGPETA